MYSFEKFRKKIHEGDAGTRKEYETTVQLVQGLIEPDPDLKDGSVCQHSIVGMQVYTKGDLLDKDQYKKHAEIDIAHCPDEKIRINSHEGEKTEYVPTAESKRLKYKMYFNVELNHAQLESQVGAAIRANQNSDMFEVCRKALLEDRSKAFREGANMLQMPNLETLKVNAAKVKAQMKSSVDALRNQPQNQDVGETFLANLAKQDEATKEESEPALKIRNFIPLQIASASDPASGDKGGGNKEGGGKAKGGGKAAKKAPIISDPVQKSNVKKEPTGTPQKMRQAAQRQGKKRYSAKGAERSQRTASPAQSAASGIGSDGPGTPRPSAIKVLHGAVKAEKVEEASECGAGSDKKGPYNPKTPEEWVQRFSLDGILSDYTYIGVISGKVPSGHLR